jgi:prepilin-type N-terminal cleavage/methylation domain-containing protein/prepilin-type processing-associated H-X9-DG protein
VNDAIRQPLCRGFSMIELLVALTVVAALLALTVPTFRRIKEDAWASQSHNNLRQLAIANLGYAADHGCFAPADDRWNNRRWHGARTGAKAPFDPTKGFLADYLGKSRQVIACPLFTELLRTKQTFEEGTGGYGYNSSYIGGLPGPLWNADGTRRSAQPAQLQRPATTVMFTTTAYARAEGLQEYPYCEPPFWDFGDGPSGYRPSPTVHFRFRGRALAAWCDGHVSFEFPGDQPEGANPHGGKASAHQLGWFGPDEENGYWNPRRSPAAR